MNQQLELIQENRVISKAKIIATSRRVRRCESNRHIWCVQSENSDNFYVVKYDDGLGSLRCDCKAFAFSLWKECKHIYSAALKEGGYV